MPEYNVQDAIAVMEILKKEVSDNARDSEDKQKLIDLIEIMATWPDMLKEKDKLLSAIDKNRRILSGIEIEVAEKEQEKIKRIAALNQTIEDAEKSTESKLSQYVHVEAEAAKESADRIQGIKNEEEKQILSWKDKTKGVKAEYDLAKKDLDTIEAKLKALKAALNEL